MTNPELLIAREVAGTLRADEADELAAGFDADAWLEDRRMDGLLRTRAREDDDFAARLRATIADRASNLKRIKNDYLGAMSWSGQIRGELLGGLTREQLLWSPRPDMPPILWHAAHLTLTDAAAWLGAWKGEWERLDPEWIRSFGMGAAMPQATEAWPSLAELEARASGIRARVVEIVDALTPGDLDRPLPHLRPALLEESIKTPADCFRMLGIHHLWHTAEINVLCRLQGRSRLL